MEIDNTDPGKDELERYIEATYTAAKRSRRSFFLICFASVLAIIASWNSRQSSWVEDRYRIIDLAIKMDSLKAEMGIEDLKSKLIGEGIKPELICLVDSFKNVRNIKDVSQLYDLKRIVDEVRKEAFIFQIPFFGVSLDVNDLGITSGLVLVILLLFCWFSLERERESLECSLEAAQKKNRLRFAYNLLSMGQVMTVPPPEGKKGPAYWWLIPKLLYLLPVAAQLLVYLYDVSTKRFGTSINPQTTGFVLDTSLVFLILIIVLTLACLIVHFRLDFEWRRYAKILSK